MRLWWTLLIACACNRAFGIDETQLPPPDAPPQCLAEGAPPFSAVVHQAVLNDCDSYTIVGTRAVARCTDLAGALAEGTVDGPLAPMAIEPTLDGARFTQPHLTPEGELMVLEVRMIAAQAVVRASVFARAGDHWQSIETLPFAVDHLSDLGVPSRRGNRHVMVTIRPTVTTGMTFEAIDGGNGTWTMIPYTAAELGVVAVRGPINLSGDGLRAVYAGTGADAFDHVFYSSRRDITERWPPGTQLDLPAVTDPFMTEDCARVYFSGIGSIFYSQQR